VAQFLIICILLLDAVIFDGMYPTLGSMIWPYGIFFVGFSVLMGIQPLRIYSQLSSLAKEQDEFAGFRYFGYAILGSLGSLILFVLTVTSYAYVIFPFVPFSKGGADYEFVRRVSIKIANSAEPKEISAPVPLTDVLILYSTTSSYYIAIPKKGNDACDWRLHLATPEILQMARKDVREISFKTESHNCF
jgi:hypothetical protein